MGKPYRLDEETGFGRAALSLRTVVPPRFVPIGASLLQHIIPPFRRIGPPLSSSVWVRRGGGLHGRQTVQIPTVWWWSVGPYGRDIPIVPIRTKASPGAGHSRGVGDSRIEFLNLANIGERPGTRQIAGLFSHRELDDIMVTALKRRHDRQRQERASAGAHEVESGSICARCTGTWCGPRNAHRDVKQMLKKAGLPLRIRPHSMRRLTTYWFNRRLGHSDAAFTIRVYAMS